MPGKIMKMNIIIHIALLICVSVLTLLIGMANAGGNHL